VAQGIEKKNWDLLAKTGKKKETLLEDSNSSNGFREEPVVQGGE